ncbi:MAG TPA: isoprenylcysteine carboxylmethyltransferase family protein [Pyrinomonadaceae bacterium]|nr:isoprenylcysteine carboxylmethyltransferase family protein [Pyrinomonadaceae bacterium]
MPLPFKLVFVKTTKILILLGIAAQTFLPDIFPIFSQPIAIRFLGAGIYTIGLLVAIVGRIQLGDNWADIERAQVHSHQAVVLNGMYAYIRHPIYVGDLLLLVGLELSLNSWLVLGVLLLAPVVIWRAAREERMLAAKLPEYQIYCAQTKRFIPFVF